jgi:hypothetical protein
MSGGRTLAPDEIGEFVDELGFGGRGRLILVEEMLDVPVEGARSLLGSTGILAVGPWR